MKKFKTITAATTACLILTFGLSFGQSLENDQYAFQPKNPSKAGLYSLLATGIPVTVGVISAFNGTLGTPELFLISGGLIVGPSVGYIYAGMNDRGSKGIVYRSLFGAGAVLLGNQMGMEIALFGGEADDDGWPVAIFGTAFLIGHALVDLAKVNSRVEEYNFQRLCEKEISINVYPTYFADSNAAGLELNITF
jgi:hypothetical protein